MAEPTLPFEAKTEAAASTSEASIQKPPEAAIEDDSDPDFDDLDDVLDQFSEAKASNQQQKSEPSVQAPSLTSGPGRPPTSSSQPALPPDLNLPSGQQPNESEEAFLARLTEEMSSVMSKMSVDPAANAATPEDLAKMGRELEEFTQKMEAEGIQPEDLLKAILGNEAGAKVGEIAHEERDRRESESKSRSKSTTTREKEKSRSPEAVRTIEEERQPPSSSSKPAQKPTTFEDTIARTMARMSESSAAATSATSTQSAQKSEEALLADLLRSLDTGEGSDGAGDDEMSKMFLGMMEQLTNKEMLYEPMKELSTKFPEWLAENQPSANKKKISKDDFERFTRQEKIVQDIVRKFEEKGYSDQDAKRREYIWEKMQEMQGEGAPPEELIANPFPGMGGMGGLGGLLGGGGGEGAPGEEGCPTQ